MNRILFYPHEVEVDGQAPAAFSSGAREFLLPRSDARAVHISTVLAGNPAVSPKKISVQTADIAKRLKAGVVGQSMGALEVLPEGSKILPEGGGEKDMAKNFLALRYTPEQDGAFCCNFDVTLLLAHPRPPVMERIIKDAATAGVRRVVAYIADLCEKSYIKSSLWTAEGHRRAALDGAMQAASLNTLPEVCAHYTLARALADLAPGERSENKSAEQGKDDVRDATLRFYFTGEATHCTDAREKVAHFCARHPRAAAVLAVGPERGFTEAEEARLEAAGFTPLSLGPTVLRCETAANRALGWYLDERARAGSMPAVVAAQAAK